MTITIYDQNGQVRDWAWLDARFGHVAVMEADASDGKEALRVIELREKEGPASLVAHLQYADGEPMRGVNVIRYWPGAPDLPDYDSPPERWKSQGVFGPTNDSGDIGFGMGTGDYYVPPGQEGASSIFCGRVSTHTDLVSGLGMLPNTVHAHIDVVFQLAPGGEPEPPTPPEPGDMTAFEEGLLERADRFLDLLEAHWIHTGAL